MSTEVKRDEREQREIERRINREMNRCVHFTGIQNETCRAGVNYRALVGGDDFGWAVRLPCFKDDSSCVACDSLRYPTREEATAEVERDDAAIKEFLAKPGNGICGKLEDVDGIHNSRSGANQ